MLIAKPCLALCNPMDSSMPDFPILHHLPEFLLKLMSIELVMLSIVIGIFSMAQGLPVSLSSVHSLSRVQLFKTPWTAAHQASLSITNSRSLPKLMSIESVMPSNHLILCGPLLLPPSIPPRIRVFSGLNLKSPRPLSGEQSRV